MGPKGSSTVYGVIALGVGVAKTELKPNPCTVLISISALEDSLLGFTFLGSHLHYQHSKTQQLIELLLPLTYHSKIQMSDAMHEDIDDGLWFRNSNCFCGLRASARILDKRNENWYKLFQCCPKDAPQLDDNLVASETHQLVLMNYFDLNELPQEGCSSFPYFALVAFEVGGILRLLFLLLATPLAGLLYYFVSESAGIQVLVFATFCETWRVFSACGKRCVLTANPTIMVEAFLKDVLGVDLVLGTKIATYKGRATGLVCKPGVLVGKNKVDAPDKAFGETQPDIGLGALLPIPLVYYAFMALGVRVTIKGTPPPQAKKSIGQSGVLFICSHRTLLDPIFLSTALGRAIPAVTYSVSRLSEIISPIKTVRLNRDWARDASMIKKLLEEGDLAILPEGTTCREPFLLRFSALFAELTDQLVPMAMVNRMSMFHGTTARGWKGMDPFYFFMNPSPAYEVTFLNKLPLELTCSSGKSSHEVANYIQRVIATTLSYKCTSFARKDKYGALVGNDGTVVEKPLLKANKVMGC
nr:glycerol-3-phosphate 2-o-acyltransferase 6 [Quercus suber]